jgi:ATP-dependent 26S proteasome regulatory subunit
MMYSAAWQEQNTRYLTTALAAIRDRLQQHAPPESPLVRASEPPPLAEEAKDAAGSGWRVFGRKQGQSTITPALPERATPPSARTPESRASSASAASAGSDASASAFGSAAADTAAASVPPALLLLAQRLGLTPFERDLLLMCAGMEFDTGFASLCARAQDPAKPYPTFALALTALQDPAWEALSPERPLRYWRLIEINQPGGQPLTTSILRADERIVNYLKGLNYLDDRLAPLVAPLDGPDVHDDGPRAAPKEMPQEMPLSHAQAADTIVARLKLSPADRKLPVVQLLGRDTATKELVAAAVAARLGLRLYRLQVSVLPSQPADLEAFARLWHRESLLLPAALYVEAETGEAEALRTQTIQLLLARLNAIAFLDTQDAWSGLGSSAIAIDVEKPTPAEQQAAWAAALGESAGESPGLLAGQFNLGVSSIREIARQALVSGADAHASTETRHTQLWKGALDAARPRLDALAQRIEPKASWDDIVLPEADMRLLKQIAAQVGQRSTVYESWGFREKTSRGLGISALFCGESGTGKTMAAEVLAGHLALHLHRIDLSAVVSKFIGQTEKNLRRLFDAAEDGGAVLFFDEADALFGKRSEVKDSHDRYANIEVNYLLQRMESYRGLAILATNMRSALDPAFLRRLRFIVTFPFPGIAERRQIWQKAFPPQTPTSGLDIDRLARLNVTGGHVHNIAMNAAFLAAQAGTAVTMPIVLEAARTEFRKLERPINDADFRWQPRPEKPDVASQVAPQVAVA